jgi:hypothetical protein
MARVTVPREFAKDFDDAAKWWMHEGITQAGVDQIRADVRIDFTPGPDTQREEKFAIHDVSERIRLWSDFVRLDAVLGRTLNV